MVLVSYIDILDFIGNDRECLIKGEELFNKNKVQGVHVSYRATGNEYEVVAACGCKETNSINVFIKISQNDKKSLALNSKCSCVPDLHGKCQHVAAVLIYLHRHPPDLLTKPQSLDQTELSNNVECNYAVKSKDSSQHNQRQLRRKRRSTVLYQSEIDEPSSILDDSKKELVDDPTWDKENGKDEDWGSSSDDNWEPISERKRTRKELTHLLPKDSSDALPKKKTTHKRIATTEKDKDLISVEPQGVDGHLSCQHCEGKFSQINQLQDHIKKNDCNKRELYVCNELKKCNNSSKCRTLKAREDICDNTCQLSPSSLEKKSEGATEDEEEGEVGEEDEEEEEGDEIEEDYEDDLDLKLLGCLMCQVVTSTRREMHDHYLVAHDKDCVSVCDRCGEFRLPGDHICPSQLSFRCRMCRARCPFKAGRDYWNHLIRASKEHGRARGVAWRCGWARCAERFASESELLAHARLHLPVHVQLMCGVCRLVLRNTDAKIAHMEKHTAAAYECGACRHACPDKEALRQHWETHARERPHRCAACGWRFASATTLKVHIRKFHEGGPFCCAKCPQKFDDRTDVRVHFGAAHGKLRCGLQGCSFRCANKAALERHARQHDEDPADEAAPRTEGTPGASGTSRTCTECGESFALLRELRAHARDVHGASSVATRPTCPECGKAFKSERGLEEHRRTHTGEKPFICAECGMTFKRAQNLDYHTKGAHKNERNFLCPECDKRFISNADMMRHLRYSHQDGKKWHLCPECGHKLPSLYNLKLHVQSRHTGERPHKCHLCDMGFVTVSDLKKHVMFKHNKEQPFACELCDKRYQRRRDLKLHTQRHHGDDPNTCPTCGKDFDTYASMMQHARYHTTEESFQCAKCGRRFPHRMNLCRHLCTPDIKKNYRCQSCGLSFTTSGSLKSHRRRLHASEHEKELQQLQEQQRAKVAAKQASQDGQQQANQANQEPRPSQRQTQPGGPGGSEGSPPSPQPQPYPQSQPEPEPEPPQPQLFVQATEGQHHHLVDLQKHQPAQPVPQVPAHHPQTLLVEVASASQDNEDKVWRGTAGDTWTLSGTEAGETILGLGTFHELQSVQPAPIPPPPVVKTMPPPLVSLQPNMGYAPLPAPVKVVTTSQPPPLAPVSQDLVQGQAGQSVILGAPIQTTADGSFHLVFVPHGSAKTRLDS